MRIVTQNKMCTSIFFSYKRFKDIKRDARESIKGNYLMQSLKISFFQRFDLSKLSGTVWKIVFPHT